VVFSLLVLGSSSVLPTAKRYPSAHVLNVHERFFLIDCGEGTQHQMRKFRVPFNKITSIFISHLHGDHVFGLFGLISSLSMLGRTKSLTIYADKKLKDVLDSHFNFFDNRLTYDIIIEGLNPEKEEIIYTDKLLTVKSFPLKHRVPVWGFHFSEKKQPDKMKKEMIDFYKISIKDIQKIKEGEGFTTNEGTFIPHETLTIPSNKPRSFAYCTDTIFHPEAIPYIVDADLLYHEATFEEQHKQVAKETYHCTSKQAASMALNSNVKQLLLGHFSSRYKNMKKLLSEAREIFPETYTVEDGMLVEIKHGPSFAHTYFSEELNV
jgi:ribonuclease Z